MTPHRPQVVHKCRVVVGSDEVVSVRAEDPTVPVLALVDESSPTESLLAQLAGADVVLAVPRFRSESDRPTGFNLAVRAAESIARRRNEIASTSRHAGHDVAEALNVIGLIADAGQHGRVDAADAFAQIQSLVRTAGDEAWRAGRGHRSSSRVVSCEDLHRLFDDGLLRSQLTGVALVLPEQDTLVFLDRDWFVEALGELIANARRAGATIVNIDASIVAGGETVEIVVSDNGVGLPGGETAVGDPFAARAGSGRLGMGLALIAEHATELGGSLELISPGGVASSGRGTLTRIALSLPSIDPRTVVSDAPAPSPSFDPAAPQANILEGVVRHAPLGESLEDIVAAIERQLPGTVCSVLLLQDGRLRHGAGGRLPLAYREAIDGVAIGVGQGSCGTAAFTGSPVIASDVTTDRNWVDFRSLATVHGLRSCWSTPIVAAEDGETLGTFAVYTSTIWGPDEDAIRLVNRFTYLAAVAIEHHRLFGALAESEARFRSAFEGAAAGIALASLEGVVLKSNPALFDIVGQPGARLAGTSLLDFVDPASRRLVTQSWSDLVTDATAHFDPVEVPLVRTGEASQKWLSLHTSLIPDEAGHQPYLYVEVRDVTAARQQLADLRAREAAEASNRAKTDFLALASHELRTPLNAILGFAQVMQLLELDESQRTNSVDQIVNAGRHLRDLIDQLLDLSRIESGQLAVEAGHVNAHRVIGEALELVGPLAAARDIDLLGDAEPNTLPAVLADHRCLRQVLINLLDNAVKYTPSGGRVEVTGESIGRSLVRITVTDSGSGISEDSLDAIFQPFYRLDQAADSDGTGLGLALCARLMREMDGTIGVTSTPGVGSTFWIDLPATTMTAADGVLSLVRSSPGTSTGGARSIITTRSAVEASVLYIEDDPACIDVMSAALRLRPEITLSAAGTAEEGAIAIASGHLDLVLLDIGLPDRSGWDLLSDIRVTHPGLPVVVLTAGPDAVPSGGATPDQVFTKPVDVTEVLQAIDLVCSRATGGGALSE